jgi:hypothetical protein
MPLTELENQLRLRARDLIQRRQLPGNEPSGMVWGGSGSGEPCSLCGQCIMPDQVEYEVDSQGRTYRLHFMCHAAWQFECARKLHLDKQQSG